MKKNVLVLLLVSSAAFLTGCRKDAPPGADVLATVSDMPVTSDAFHHHWEQRGGRRASTPAERRAALDELVERAALAAKARELGLADDPEVVAQFENLLVRRLREKQLEPILAAVEVSEDEVLAYYEANREDKFSTPARDRLAVLWFRTHGMEPLVARYLPRMEEARAAVIAQPEQFPPRAGFGKLAVTCSEHRASRYKGGDLGWIAESERKTPAGFLSNVAGIGRDLREVGDVSG
ncbi:MAG: hypothetical protein ACR2RV_16755, partial [Verrucomicrobiales bacterium]